VEIAYME